MTLALAHPLTIHENGDTYFQGNLEAGKTLAGQDRYLFDGRHPEGGFFAHLADDEEGDEVAEWGGGQTQEEAWRFALGAYFGPIDAEYDEQWLIANLQVAPHLWKEHA